jgi:hypothetical protein
MKKRGYIVMYADKSDTYNTPADGKRRQNHKIYWRTWTDERHPLTYEEAKSEMQDYIDDVGTDDYLWRIFAVKGPIDELEAAEQDSRTYPRTDKGSTSSEYVVSGVGVDKWAVYYRYGESSDLPKHWRSAGVLFDDKVEAEDYAVELQNANEGLEAVVRLVSLPA